MIWLFVILIVATVIWAFVKVGFGVKDVQKNPNSKGSKVFLTMSIIGVIMFLIIIFLNYSGG